jgi:predicted nucleic acid-binding protein
VQLVDTNVLAYLLIAGDRTPAAQALFKRDPEWRSEAFALVEFSNLLCTYVRSEAMTEAQAVRLLASATALLPVLPSVPHAVALEAALEFNVSAYDARFIALAMQSKTRLVTEDRKLRASVPAWTTSLEDAIG